MRVLASLLFIFLSATSAYAWTASLNFRSTSAFIADGGAENKVIAGTDLANGTGEQYPVSRSNGTDTITYGWLEGTVDTRDRNVTPGVHFAGTHFNGANLNRFQLDLPCTGVAAIKVAAGDYSNGQAVTKVEIFDDTASLMTIGTGGTSGADKFIAQDGSEYSSAGWAAVAAVNQTFATTTMIVKVGNNAAPATGFLAHLEVSMTCSAGSTFYRRRAN